MELFVNNGTLLVILTMEHTECGHKEALDCVISYTCVWIHRQGSSGNAFWS